MVILRIVIYFLIGLVWVWLFNRVFRTYRWGEIPPLIHFMFWPFLATWVLIDAITRKVNNFLDNL